LGIALVAGAYSLVGYGSVPRVNSTEVSVRATLLAGAIAVAAAVAMPIYAQAPGTNPNPQPGAPSPTAPERQGGDAGAARGPWMHGGGGWAMRGGPMMHRGGWRQRAMRGDPQQRCIDRLARRAAHRAYLGTELNLTPQQQPLWDKLQNVAQSAQQRERQLCSQLIPDSEMTLLDRIDRAQQFLSAHLAALQAAKPAVQALYQALTPAQKAIFDHPFDRH
jgi:hypothetical protein